MSSDVWQVVVFDDGGHGWGWRALGSDGLAVAASENSYPTPERAEQHARGLFPTAQIVHASGTQATAPPTGPMPYPRAAALAEERATRDATVDAELASWGRRAVALILDGLIVFGVIFVLLTILVAFDPSGFDDPATETTTSDEWGALLLGLSFILAPGLYAWVMLGAWGQTLGMMALRIRCVRADDLNRIGYAKALGRVASVWLLSILYLPIILSYLWPLWDSRNQTLQDKLASTVVVRA